MQIGKIFGHHKNHENQTLNMPYLLEKCRFKIFFFQKESLHCCLCTKFSSSGKVIFIFSCIFSLVSWDTFFMNDPIPVSAIQFTFYKSATSPHDFPDGNPCFRSISYTSCRSSPSTIPFHLDVAGANSNFSYSSNYKCTHNKEILL